MAIAGINAALRRVPPWAVYLAAAAWAAWLFRLGLTGGLGPEPINALEREYGQAALWLLVAGLAVSPLRRIAGINLMRQRRAIGVAAFGLVLAHLAVWALLDLQSVTRLWEDLTRRPYIVVGAGAFLLLLPLALTSNDWSVRRLGGAGWRRLHRLVYPAAILVALHYLWIGKVQETEPLVWSAAILLLLVLRIRWARAPRTV